MQLQDLWADRQTDRMIPLYPPYTLFFGRLIKLLNTSEYRDIKISKKYVTNTNPVEDLISSLS